MSIRLMSEIWKKAPEVKSERLLVLLALADWANDDGVCFPKMETIAAKTRTSKDGASRIVEWLEKEGYLTVFRGQGRGHKSTYIVHSEPCKNTEKASIKGDPDNPFYEPVKGDPESPFSEVIKGDPESEKAILNRIKGDPESEHINGTRAGLTTNEPSIEPSDDVRNGYENSSSPTPEKRMVLIQATVSILGKEAQWQMGAVSPKFQQKVRAFAELVEQQGRSPDDLQTWRETLPVYLGINPATFTQPNINQLLDTFDSVLDFAAQQQANRPIDLEDLRRRTAALKQEKTNGEKHEYAGNSK